MEVIYFEKNAEYADQLKYLLSYWNYKVYIVYHLKQLSDLLKSVHPDIILVDEAFLHAENSELFHDLKITYPNSSFLFIVVSDNLNFYSSYIDLNPEFIQKHHLIDEIYFRCQIVYWKQQYTTSLFHRFRLNENCLFDYTQKKLQVAGQNYHLTNIETEIMVELCKNINQLTSQEKLIKKCWANEENAQRYLDHYMVNLRKYLKSDETLELLTLRKKGYCLRNIKN